jgi:LacI family transcriptional regulator
VPDSVETVLQGDFTQESGWRAGNQLVALTERPSAVFASNDMMAIGCMSALSDAGLQIPQDISLAGFDDIPTSRYISPSLTSVRARITELGALALERLASCIEEPARITAQRQTLRTDLMLRASTAAPHTKR